MNGTTTTRVLECEPRCPWRFLRARSRPASAIFLKITEAEARERGRGRTRAFTLIELVLVLAVLAVVLGVAAPSLSRFFQGRKLDEEAQRFLALTRYGQSRAIAEGVPMVLWLDLDQRLYGLTAEQTYTGEDPRAVQFELDDRLLVELELPTPGEGTTPWPQTELVAGHVPAIRFTPDGFISETSPERILFIQETDVDESIIAVALNRYRLRYEIQTNLVEIARR